MTLRLYDTLTRSVRDFVPREPGKVGVYLCGLTVQSGPHIGHLRSGVNYDVLRRWFLHSGYEVTFIRNITDIDDKVLAKAIESGDPFWSIAYANERILEAAYRALNVLPPTYEPRATGHITEMHSLIATLIDDGHAYVAKDNSGDVYFDVHSYPPYGQLSGRSRTRCRPPRTDRNAPSATRRTSRCGRASSPANRTTPTGRRRGAAAARAGTSSARRCASVISGQEFDIHGGGLDLMFPHHENEIAQSRAAGLGFARYWVHHALLNLGEAKMSKSLGNVIDLTR